MQFRVWVIGLAAMLLTGCYQKTDSPRGSWAKGCDLSWLSEMEHDGMLFYAPSEDNTQPSDCIDLLREQGMNAVRLRVWVNHQTGWSNLPDMLELAKRAAKAGQRIMVDIHYSDFFADPHRQDIPVAWINYDFDLMQEAVQEYTLFVLYALKEEGIRPEWVQIGNETPNGMLWPIGYLSPNADGTRGTDEEWQRYATLTTVGYKAAKEAFPDITVIVHVDNAYEYRDWFWRQMQAHGGQWDMIGLSHYPMMSAWNGGKTWQEMNELAEQNVQQLISEFHTPVMICEVGMFANDPESEYVMADFVQRMERIDSCKGIFYWEPQVYGGWRPAEYIPLGWGSYDMGAFTPDGRPSKVLQTLLQSHS